MCFLPINFLFIIVVSTEKGTAASDDEVCVLAKIKRAQSVALLLLLLYHVVFSLSASGTPWFNKHFTAFHADFFSAGNFSLEHKPHTDTIAEALT